MSLLQMGKYPTLERNTEEELYWITLFEDESKRLLISEYGIDAMVYHEKRKKTFWENSDLRCWMQWFYNHCFSEEEKQKIILHKNDNCSGFEWDQGNLNITEDFVFALSADEAKEYFKMNEERKAKPTPWAVQRGAYVFEELGGTITWWLRSPGRRKGGSASVVRADGGIYRSADMNVANICVRPAMWVLK